MSGDGLMPAGIVRRKLLVIRSLMPEQNPGESSQRLPSLRLPEGSPALTARQKLHWVTSRLGIKMGHVLYRSTASEPVPKILSRLQPDRLCHEPPQARQGYLGRRIARTRNPAGTMSRRSARSSPITYRAAGAAVILDVDHHLDPWRWLGREPRLAGAWRRASRSAGDLVS
jgi:hypothetical protein